MPRVRLLAIADRRAFAAGAQPHPGPAPPATPEAGGPPTEALHLQTPPVEPKLADARRSRQACAAGNRRQDGGALIEATVSVVKGGKKTAQTDVDGFFGFKLAPGITTCASSTSCTKAGDPGVVVRDGEVRALDVALTSDAEAAQEVVEAKVETRTRRLECRSANGPRR